MLVNITAEILDLNGASADPPLLLRTVLTEALLSPLRGDEGLVGGDKARHFRLAMRIAAADTSIDLIAEEVALLKDRIGRGYPALVVGRAWDLLDPVAPSEPGVGGKTD